jgi:hypothetical protein
MCGLRQVEFINAFLEKREKIKPYHTYISARPDNLVTRYNYSSSSTLSQDLELFGTEQEPSASKFASVPRRL